MVCVYFSSSCKATCSTSSCFPNASVWLYKNHVLSGPCFWQLGWVDDDSPQKQTWHPRIVTLGLIRRYRNKMPIVYTHLKRAESGNLSSLFEIDDEY